MSRWFSIIVFAIAGTLQIVTALGQEDSLYSESQIYRQRTVQDRYLAPSFLHSLDNLFDKVFVHNDAHSQFAEIEDPFVSIQGGSYRWNRWYLNDHRFTQVLTPGTPLQRISSHLFDVEVTAEQQSIRLDGLPQKSGIRFKYDNGFIGTWLPGADDIINFIYGHESARQTALQTFEHRRRIRNQLEVNASFSTPNKGRKMSQHINLLAGSRQHTSFDHAGLSGVFPETYIDLAAMGQLPFGNWNYALGWKNRSHYLSEYGFNSAESAELTDWHLSLYRKWTAPNHFSGSSGFNFQTKKISHNDEDFARNVVDQDGEGFESWYPTHSGTSLSHHFTLNKIFEALAGLSLTWESFNSLLWHRPLRPLSSHSVFHQTTEADFSSLYLYSFESKPFHSLLLENELRADYTCTSRNGRWIWMSQIGISLDGFRLEAGKSKISSQLTMQVGIRHRFPHARLSMTLRKGRVPYSYDVLQFLSSDYLSGEIFYWDDTNQDHLFDANERGERFGLTGGNVRKLGTGLRQPSIYSLTVPYLLAISNHWEFGLTGDFQSFRNTWSVEYEQDLDEIGSFHTISDLQIFRLDESSTPTFRVVPFRTDLAEMATGKTSFLFRHPFSSGVTMHLRHVSQKWWMYFSFRAYMAVGFGPLGNGAQVNQLHTLSENLANPNTYLHYYGRLDSDRSFISKFAISYQPNRKWTCVFQIKYKDGQPFNFFNTYLHQATDGQTQLSIWNEGVKGDNPFTGEFNSRTHGLWNVEFRVARRIKLAGGWLRLQISGYNLLDLGLAIREYTFAPAVVWERHALDLELPRALSLTASYDW
ncbi:MAG: hypothetical protein OEQ53_08080 [Saprospiraceae bacterium]|nr:hypothetical protein [Saprospiraceae bacterium]